MWFQLVMVFVIPVMLGISIVSPFDLEEKQEQSEEEIMPTTGDDDSIEQKEKTLAMLHILLAAVWVFFIIQVLRGLILSRSKNSRITHK